MHRLHVGGKVGHHSQFLRSRRIAYLGAHSLQNEESSDVRADDMFTSRSNHHECHEDHFSAVGPPTNSDDNQLEAVSSGGVRSIQSENGPYLEHKLTAHGSHVMLDLTGFFVDATEGAALVLTVVRAAVARSRAREMHAKSVVLGNDGLSPPGFTSVVLIDESHVTAHCYSELGWLAIDCFTCGANSKMPQVRGPTILQIERGFNAIHSTILHHKFSIHNSARVINSGNVGLHLS